MSDDRAFLDSIQDDPADAARWLIYADWLDDHNDPRGEYLRLVLALAVTTFPDPDRRRRLNAVRPTLARAWLAEVEQPALIRANPTPYPFDWSGVGLDGARPSDATYTGYAYRSLPPVPPEWIVRFEDWYSRVAADVPPGGRQPDDEDEDEEMAEMRAVREEDRLNAIPRLSDVANDFGLKLPDLFARFFMNDRHSGLFRSVTDCSFNLPERIAPAPDCPEAGLIRFYSDSQGCLHWYLYLTPEGDESVVTSGAHLGGDWVMRQMSERSGWRYEEDEPDPREPFWFCAPSFAEFIIRTWLENMAWYSLHAQYAGPIETRGAQAPEVAAYLGHYRSCP
ncbi:MAG TPA: TIGR02996 domain-containing protein [Gemmataceae bacterium]|nr:TIGR02996 domain-containing protein [Gemmataceae bacterium]